MKLSKRDRYILKYNGPKALKHKKRVYRQCKAMMGHGDESTRVVSTAYVLRFQGWFPDNWREFHRLAGFSP